MASSKLMASAISTNSDLPRQSSICSLTIADLQTDHTKNFGSMSMEDLLKNIYSDSLSPETFPPLPPPPPPASASASAAVGNGSSGDGGGVTVSRQGSFSLPKSVGNKTVDEVWKEIISGNDPRRGVVAQGGGEGMMEEMTLEDFLTKAGAVREEDVRVPVMPGPGGYGVDSSIINGDGGNQFQNQMQAQGVDGSMVVFGNGIDGRVVVSGGVEGGGGGGGGGGRAGRGKRRAVEETVDKATQQKQRRMIKNRESAARSRERKQAYTVELEALVTQLEEENARLLREEAEESKERFKQLMENLIPVVEKRKEPRVLRRVHSMQW